MFLGDNDWSDMMGEVRADLGAGMKIDWRRTGGD